jgi:glucokinase-like ROK family protein
MKADHRMMREVNRSLVLDVVRAAGPLSRTDIARHTSLAKPTVSDLIDHLVTEGVVREVGVGATTRQGGRPPSLVEFNERSCAYLGVDFGVHRTNVAVADGLGHIVEVRSAASRPGEPQATVELAHRLAVEALAATKTPEGLVEGVAATVAGAVDFDTGHLALAPNLGWRDFPLGQSLEAAFGRPASVYNVTHAAAFAEGVEGAAVGEKQFVWVYVGTGVGAGIVLDGQVFRGDRGFAGELGHCPVEDNGERCGCGRRGCLETVASAPAIVRAAEAARSARKRTALSSLSLPIDARAVVGVANEGDEVARRILAGVGEHLGRGIAYLLNILNPGLVVVGGAVSGAGDVLFEPLRRSLAAHALDATQVAVVPSTLGDRAELIGAVRLAAASGTIAPRLVNQ